MSASSTVVPYLHRWRLEPGLLGVEAELIEAGQLPLTGVRFSAIRALSAGGVALEIGLGDRRDRRLNRTAAASLRLVQGKVAALDELIELLGAVPDRDAGRERGEGRGHVDQAVDGAERAVRSRVGEQGDELVATEASDDVAGAHRRFQPFGGLAQDPVALGVAASVVELLEGVEVEQDERDRRPRPRGARKLARRRLAPAAAIEQAGEVVEHRLAAQVAVEALHLLRERPKRSGHRRARRSRAVPRGPS